jgi:hypothetical protein
MGLYKGKAQSIFTGPYILPSADKKGKKERRSYLLRSTKYLVLD